MAGIYTKTTTLAQKSLDFRSKRHDLLSSNVANMSTPGYQAEDMVFESTLAAAMNADQPGPLKTNNPRHLDGKTAPPLELAQAQRIRSANPNPSENGNTVDLDREMAKIAENQMMYNASLLMLQHEFRMLKTAITEGR